MKSMVRSNQVTRVPTYLPERGRKGREIPLKQVVPPPPDAPSPHGCRSSDRTAAAAEGHSDGQPRQQVQAALFCSTGRHQQRREEAETRQ